MFRQVSLGVCLPSIKALFRWQIPLAVGLLALGTVTLHGATIELAAGGGTAASGPVKDVQLMEPFAVAFDRNGNWYICEYKGHRVMRVTPKGEAAVLVGTGEAGDSGDGGPAAKAQLRSPHEVLVSPDQMLYIADTFNHRVRRVDLKTGTIATVVGTGTAGFSGDGGPAAQAAFNEAYAVALDRSGRQLSVVDLRNRRVRSVDLRSGVVTTIIGNGQEGTPRDGAAATESPLMDPRAIAVDSSGNRYLLERRGNALRMIGKDGLMRTLVGPTAVTPPLNGPKHLCVDRQGNVFIADTENHLVRRYSPKDGKLVTLVGTGSKGSRLVPNDPLQTELSRPHGVAIGPDGSLYISDSDNNRVLRLKL